MAGDTSDTYNIGAIVLAAGSSSRLGTPKQVLPYAGITLLQHSIDAAIGSGAQPVVVVLGAHADIIKKQVENDNALVVINAEWQEGIASSIRCGINALLGVNPLVEGAVLVLCDQPYVSSTLLNQLITTYQKSGKHIVACNYGNAIGPPAFFHKAIFPELLQLKGDMGAKKHISQHAGDVEEISFPEGGIDIDTEADYQTLSKDGRTP